MKIEDVKPGITKVKTSTYGPTLTIKSTCGRLVKLVLIDDTYRRRKRMGIMPGFDGG